MSLGLSLCLLMGGKRKEEEEEEGRVAEDAKGSCETDETATAAVALVGSSFCIAALLRKE